jgi:CBS domain-containing protein
VKTLYATRLPDSQGRLSRRRVTEVMHQPAPVVSGRLQLPLALATMVRLGVRHVVAVDDEGRCLGVLSDRAIATRWAGASSPLLKQTVVSALDLRPAVVPTSWVVANTARFMLDAGVDAVAVADPEGRPVGLLTGAGLIALLCGDPDTPKGGEHHVVDP